MEVFNKQEIKNFIEYFKEYCDDNNEDYENNFLSLQDEIHYDTANIIFNKTVIIDLDFLDTKDLIYKKDLYKYAKWVYEIWMKICPLSSNLNVLFYIMDYPFYPNKLGVLALGSIKRINTNLFQIDFLNNKYSLNKIIND